MTLTSGARLGPYEVISPLGAGGMGEVYKARDTRLDRTVAIKVLPERSAPTPDARQRFEREARTISQLSHPHICALYDVGREGETEYLVMEYLEGETLSERLAKGPLPLDQTLRYGTEIADALDKAHRQGIVHRDLKPANVMLTKSGVKLLDFGLAKALPPGKAEALTSLPTQANLTQEGTILGTFQYMAPEQLEGKEADARTDIFSFGAVLYEMATGKKAFTAASQASLITAIMSSDPAPISSVQPMTPPALDRVVKTCLAKDPEERWQSAHDVGSELKWIAEGSQAGVPAAVVSRRKNRERLAWIIAAALAIVAATAIIGYFRRAPAPAEPVRFEIFPPVKGIFNNVDGPVSVSPDGHKLVFGVRDETGNSFLWVRSFDSMEAHRLDGTEDGYDPFWSPDGRFIAFGSGASGKLLRIDAGGGPVQVICDMTDGRGGSWNRDNVVLLTTNGGASPILRVPAGGGTPVPVTSLDKSRGEIGHWRPRFLPDGKHFLFLVRSSQPQNAGMAVGSLDSKEIVRLSGIDTAASWAPPGLLLFVRERTLMAQPFDNGRLRLSGDPFPVAKDIDYTQTFAAAAFSTSDNGILAYQSGGRAIRRLVWFDRSGKELGTLGDAGEYRGDPRISRDGRQVVAMRMDPESRVADLWTFNISRGLGSRLTFDPSIEEYPIWSPDGDSLIFGSNRDGVGDIYRKNLVAGGSEEQLLKSDHWKNPDDWSPDGRYVVYNLRDPKTRMDLWLLPLFGEKKPVPLVVAPFSQRRARFSPDGKWFAYVSNESGKDEIYVQPFPPTGPKWQISQGGGEWPRWAKGGRELSYVGPDYMLKVVEIKTSAAFEAGVPTNLFKTPNAWGSDVTPDGQRFLVNLPAGDNPPSPTTVVLRWDAELAKK
jgi:eukaryotic-like serine/threonine-protein kinase